MSWREKAICRDEDPELFFPVGSYAPARAQLAAAKEVCSRCPVRVNCLSWALRNDVLEGVWGGTDEDERRELVRDAGGVPDR